MNILAISVRHRRALPRPALPACLLAAVFGAGPWQPARADGPALAPATLAAAVALVRQTAAIGAPAGARIEVEPGALDSRLHLAPCARIQPEMGPTMRPWGRTRVGLRCVQGPTPWNVFLPVTVKVFAPALVGALALLPGTALEPAQLRLAEVDWAAAPASALTDAQALAGRVLAHPLAAGQALRSTDLQPRQWFAAGDTVRITASGAGFSVSGEGQALSNGFEGRSARVRTDGGRVVSGLPVGDRQLEVAL